jgi:hypothetical protein
MKQALGLLPAILLVISSVLAFIHPEKYILHLLISAVAFMISQLLTQLEQPDVIAIIKALDEKHSKELQALQEDTHKKMAELRDDFAKASMIISNKAAANPSTPKHKQMVF